MKFILTFLVFILCGLAAFSILGAGAVALAASGTLPDTAMGHYILSAIYFMLSGSLIFSAVGMVLGIITGVIGFLLLSRLRTIISFALAIILGAIWYFLLTCEL
ncbi:MAG: hypothetical protein IKB25_01415 [Lentisphaeria bacterium]|nr:hypothetical protein [Lentisphaeria bacterium]